MVGDRPRSFIDHDRNSMDRSGVGPGRLSRCCISDGDPLWSGLAGVRAGWRMRRRHHQSVRDRRGGPDRIRRSRLLRGREPDRVDAAIGVEPRTRHRLCCDHRCRGGYVCNAGLPPGGGYRRLVPVLPGVGCGVLRAFPGRTRAVSQAPSRNLSRRACLARVWEPRVGSRR